MTDLALPLHLRLTIAVRDLRALANELLRLPNNATDAELAAIQNRMRASAEMIVTALAERRRERA